MNWGTATPCGKPVKVWADLEKPSPISLKVRLLRLANRLTVLLVITGLAYGFLTAWPNGPLTMYLVVFPVGSVSLSSSTSSDLLPVRIDLFVLTMITGLIWTRSLFGVLRNCYKLACYSSFYARIHGRIADWKLLRTQQGNGGSGSIEQ